MRVMVFLKGDSKPFEVEAEYLRVARAEPDFAKAVAEAKIGYLVVAFENVLAIRFCI
jgi:hypothetical protein